MERGFVKLWRKSTDSGMMQNHKLWVFWTWCLLKATHKKREQMVGMQMVTLEPGDFIFGRKAASRELKISEQTIRTCVQNLKKLENLTIKTTNKFSIISIVNWGIYQQEKNQINQQINQQLTNNQPTTNHKQECKECKECKEYISSEEDKSKPEVSTPCPHEKIRELYNSLLPELVTCTNRNKVFDKHTKSRWNESKDRQDMTWWENFFKSVRDSDFLMGRTDKPFTCSLDWLVKPSNFTKVLNGNYINRNNTQKGSIEKWAL